jgi:hypothetical protein
LHSFCCDLIAKERMVVCHPERGEGPDFKNKAAID